MCVHDSSLCLSKCAPAAFHRISITLCGTRGLRHLRDRLQIVNKRHRAKGQTRRSLSERGVSCTVVITVEGHEVTPAPRTFNRHQLLGMGRRTWGGGTQRDRLPMSSHESPSLQAGLLRSANPGPSSPTCCQEGHQHRAGTCCFSRSAITFCRKAGSLPRRRV